jgi:hypothetical protein
VGYGTWHTFNVSIHYPGLLLAQKRIDVLQGAIVQAADVLKRIKVDGKGERLSEGRRRTE